MISSSVATDEMTDDDQRVEASRGACAFTIRLWREDLCASSEYRGTVRDVRTRAFRAFRDWSDLVAFMVARLEDGRASDGAPSDNDIELRPGGAR